MRPRREEYYSSNADVFVPEAGMRANEFGHQTDAFRVAQNHQFDASGAKIRFGALKRLILADHDPGNLVEQRRAAAHVAGREGRVEGGAAVFAGFQAPRVFDAVHLGVKDRALLLNAAIVSPP